MSTVLQTPWSPGREDRGSLLLIFLLPIIVASPGLLGMSMADPMLYLSGLTVGLQPGVLKGAPYIDPNSGYNTQALGHLSAWLWTQGSVPWWNHYTGIGLPLAAQYQPGSFFPLTMLLLLPHGFAWMQVALQILAGLGTFMLLRQLGLGRMASTIGGLLYAFNGTLAWFSHAPAAPVPFLPWMLLGIERIAIHARASRPGGWAMLTAAMAMSLLASFPETAYLSGLLALAWTLLRAVQLPVPARRAYALAIVAGGLTGIAIAAPQVYSFLEYLRHADIGEHGHRFAHESMSQLNIVQSLIAPYFFGPIFAFLDGRNEPVIYLWSGIGGYVTLALLAAAIAGFWSRRDALGWLLMGWCVLTLLRTFGFPGLSHLWNLIPGVSLAAFYRYACPSWELALVLLAARGIDAWARDERRRSARLAAGWTFAAGLAVTAYVVTVPASTLIEATRLPAWAVGSMVVAGLCALTVAILAARGPRAAFAIGAMLVAEAMVMFAIPTMSNPRAGEVDTRAAKFLQDNLGFQRFYTLAPFQPNYGAYFRVASINYNVLPNSRKWHKWVQDMLDMQADSVVFNGVRGGEDSQAAMLKRHRVNYEEVGVRFVLASRNTSPFGPEDGVKLVYQDEIMDIYELPGAKPYFDTIKGNCTLQAPDRDRVSVDCPAEDHLFRRELFHPGWTATVSGAPTPVEEHLDLYQAVKVPAGKSEIRFDYAPRHITGAWLVALLGLVISIGAPVLRRARR